MVKTGYSATTTLLARRLILLLLLPAIFLSIFLCSHRAAQAGAVAQSLDAKSRIITASGVRLRAAPSIAADEVARLQLGAIVRELEQSASKERVGGSEDYWYRVAAADGKEGWVFGTLTARFDPAKKEQTYLSLASSRLKAEQASFTELADLVRFLTTARSEVASREAAAELELARLVAMKRALASLSYEEREQPAYQAWIKANEGDLVYSEPSATWLVRSDRFWELQKRYGALEVGDRIAWEGAKNNLPGECEGYLPCFLGYLSLTYGKYLSLYPRGAHAEEALAELMTSMESSYDGLTSSVRPTAEERKEGRERLSELRAAVSKTSGANRDAVLEQIKRYEAYYR